MESNFTFDLIAIIVIVISVSASILIVCFRPKSIVWKWIDLFWIAFSLLTVGYTYYTFASKDFEVGLNLVRQETEKIKHAISHAENKLGCNPFSRGIYLGMSKMEKECLYLDILKNDLDDLIQSGSKIRNDIVIYDANTRYEKGEMKICRGPTITQGFPTWNFPYSAKSDYYDVILVNDVNKVVGAAIIEINKSLDIINAWRAMPFFGKITSDRFVKVIIWAFLILFPLRVGKSAADIVASKKTPLGPVDTELLLKQLKLAENKLQLDEGKLKSATDQLKSVKGELEQVKGELNIVVSGVRTLKNLLMLTIGSLAIMLLAIVFK